MLQWIGTIFGILGSFLVAENIRVFGYSAFMISSVAFVAYGIKDKNRAILVLNLVFLIPNLRGLWNSLL